MRVRPGRLRHLLSLQSVTETNVAGELTETWAEIATAWGRVRPLSGQELYRAQEHYATVTHLIDIRWDDRLAALDAKHRIVWGSRSFDIIAVLDPEERNDRLEVYAVERNQ